VYQPSAMSTRSNIWVREEGAPELRRRLLTEQARALDEVVRRPPAGPGAAHASPASVSAPLASCRCLPAHVPMTTLMSVCPVRVSLLSQPMQIRRRPLPRSCRQLADTAGGSYAAAALLSLPAS